MEKIKTNESFRVYLPKPLFDDEKDRVDFYFYVKKVKITQKESTGKVRASGRVSSPSAENSLDDVESMTP